MNGAAENARAPSTSLETHCRAAHYVRLLVLTNIVLVLRSSRLQHPRNAMLKIRCTADKFYFIV